MTRDENLGLILGLAAVLMFSLTLPASKYAVEVIHPLVVWSGRAVLAALLGVAYLVSIKAKLPDRAHWRDLGLVTFGVVIGWPLLNTVAVLTASSAQAAVANGLLTLATALVGAYIAKERPSTGFWCLAVFGSAVVMAYALYRGGGRLVMSDALFFLGVFCAGIGYSFGGKLARHMPGLAVIAWALLLGLVITLPALVFSLQHYPLDPSKVSSRHLGAFLYLAVVSQFLGFFFWYRGLALGGIARVSQVQLLQLFFTLIFSAWLLGEEVDSVTWLCGALVVVILIASKRMKITR